MPQPGDPSPVTVTDELLAMVLDVQRDLVTQIQGLRRDLAAPARSAAPATGRTGASGPTRPGTGARVPGPVGLIEPSPRRTRRRTASSDTSD